MELMKVKASCKKTQGEYVVIAKEDFDKKIHKEYKEPKKKAPKAEKLDEGDDLPEVK